MISASTLLPSLALDRVSMGGGFAAWRNVAEQAYLSGRFVQRAVPALRVGSMGRDASLKGWSLFIMVHRRQTEGDFELIVSRRSISAVAFALTLGGLTV